LSIGGYEFNTTFKNISVTTFVAEIEVPREIHRPDMPNVVSALLTELHMRYKFHPMNPNKKHTFSKPILFID
jgi:hypothetical protein